jgi:type I restriction enzyme S subunit
LKTVRLGDILEIQNGFAFDSSLFSEKEGFPLIRIRDLKEGATTDTRYKGKFDESFVVRKGDYLIGMDGEFRCYKWKGEDALLNQRVCRLIKFDSGVCPEFIFYGINLHLARIERNTAFVTVKHISSKQIKEIRFSFPPLADQIQIANTLSKAESLINQRKESLRLLDEFLKSTFLELFGDPVKNDKNWKQQNLEDLCIKIADIDHKMPKAVDDGYPFISAKDLLDNGTLSFDDVKKISKEDFIQLSKKIKPQKGDIIY